MFSFTVATINLWGRKDRWLARRHLLVGELVDITPDLIALQDISLSIGQGTWLMRQVNIRLTGNSRLPYRIIQARHRHPGHMMEAVGVMTSLPIIFHDSFVLGDEGRVALRVNVEIPSEKSTMRRQSLDFVALHLPHHAIGREARLEQAMTLVGWLNEKRRNPLQVIAGDFNDSPDSPVITFMRQSHRSAFADYHGRDPLATYPTNLLSPPFDRAVCLDYVFVSPAVNRVSKAGLLGDKPAPDDETLYPSGHVGLLIGVEV